MRFAKSLFWLAGIAGVILVAPAYFTERLTADIDPPAVNHPEYFYGFVGIVLAWQFVYLVIASDPMRFRPIMLLGAFGKGGFAIALVILFLLGRVAPLWLTFVVFDGTLAILFVVAYARLAGPPSVSRPREITKVNLRDKFSSIHDHWNPRVAGELNGQQAKLVKFRGEFVWHHHDVEDELFLVVAGRFRMDFRDRQIWLEEGEFLVVPHGVEHRPVAPEEVSVLLFEPASTLNTGNVRSERTVTDLQRV